MPCDNAAVLGRLAEELIVPESHGPAEQLAGRHRERRRPEHIMKAGRNPPRPQGMKQHFRRIDRFVGMKFVKQIVSGVLWIGQLGQLVAEDLDLPIVEHTHTGQIAVLVIERDLLVA